MSCHKVPPLPFSAPAGRCGEDAASKLRSPVRADEEVSKTRVEVIVAALKERLRARVALQRQLDALVKVRFSQKEAFISAVCFGFVHMLS